MADSAIAIIESTSNLQSTSNMATLPSVSISADIQVENLAMPITSSSIINRECNSGTSSASDDKLCDNDGETAKKKRKLSCNNIKKGLENNDKLENRLGGILSCAVCLDLPNHAIFQVIHVNVEYTTLLLH